MLCPPCASLQPCAKVTDLLVHVVPTSSKLNKDINYTTQAVRVCATAPDREIFTARIATDANLFEMQLGVGERLETLPYPIVDNITYYREYQNEHGGGNFLVGVLKGARWR